ncbi:hypothetical protein MNEG_15085 [Monoraphidium neglectum]|uniref:Uncharacterized protein n=1 Tax=Monoraphidium neglectum TaxID=145388 RepID=A0A0D2K9Z2_9CHLO|nr:hypothetical protein MNEG_15085 [Monoraphidium neglectum]KIY92878.1 hypothetical protein MNEG_15085 [Monoraphidium neglectum]|eukprot:XP_013891898.1 hypothetical protein MNEG_15085 [Monoraphidium neglectum]
MAAYCAAPDKRAAGREPLRGGWEGRASATHPCRSPDRLRPPVYRSLCALDASRPCCGRGAAPAPCGKARGGGRARGPAASGRARPPWRRGCLNSAGRRGAVAPEGVRPPR